SRRSQVEAERCSAEAASSMARRSAGSNRTVRSGDLRRFMFGNVLTMSRKGKRASPTHATLSGGSDMPLRELPGQPHPLRHHHDPARADEEPLLVLLGVEADLQPRR